MDVAAGPPRQPHASMPANARRFTEIVARERSRRGNFTRCMPPEPGIRPSVTSGRPTRADSGATRPWQASAHSSPPPSATPAMAATGGLALSSLQAMTAGRIGSCNWRGVPDSVASAPAEKPLALPVSATARTDGFACAASSSATIFAPSAALRLLTGALSSVMTATPSVTRGLVARSVGSKAFSRRASGACR